MRFTATVAWGLERALVDELTSLGLKDIEFAPGSVSFAGPLADGYRACLWSRIASRVLLHVADVDASNGDSLYDGSRKIAWREHLGADQTLSVVCVGGNDEIRHPHFGAVRVKDAVCDQLREAVGARPSVDRANPDVQIHVHIQKDRGAIAIDLSGRPLHFRDRDRDGGPAPLRETLAAGILRMARWPDWVKDGGLLVDPMCGSGTIVIEAADIVVDRAPGIRRKKWGFTRWRGHDAALWATAMQEAHDRLLPAKGMRVFASDRDKEQIQRLKDNLDRAGMRGEVRVLQAPLSQAHPPGPGRDKLPRGLLVTNPPYGVRLGEQDEVDATWKELGDVLRRRFMGWEGWLLAGDTQLAKRLGLKPKRKHELRNGQLEARLLEVPIRLEPVARDVEPDLI